jgi:hypothetical protein
MTEINRPFACRLCGGNLPANASFCPSCGARVTLYQVHRQTLGLEPAQLLGGLTAMASVLAAVMFVAGAWIAGVLLVVVAIGLGTLLLAAIRREPHSRLALVVARASARAVSVTRLAAVTAREWTRAALKLADHVRRETRRQAPAVMGAARREIEQERVGGHPTESLSAARIRSASRLLERRPQAVDREPARR